MKNQNSLLMPVVAAAIVAAAITGAGLYGFHRNQEAAQRAATTQIGRAHV